MGVFSKLKGIFYDEVEVPEEEEKKELDKVSKIVKKEPKEKNEIPKIEEVKYKPAPVEGEPVKEEEAIKTENTFNERELFRSERTFNFVDSDNDEEEEEKPVSRRNVLSEQNRNVVENPAKELQTDTAKPFKPTPVISPIWEF